MNELRQQIQNDRERLVALRRDFHRHPELSLREIRTARVIEAELDKLGISHSRVGETGVLGILDGRGPGGGVIALRADIDALPVQEENDADYRSETDGIMHACGHDAHITCLLGAAKALAERREQFGGQVRFLFQQAEEIGKGALQFLEAGALEGAERVFGLHCAPDLPVGTIGVTPGLNNAAVDLFRISVQGESAHVSSPHLGADALYAASQIVVALQGLAARRISPTEPVILGVGKLNAGTAYNAVAAHAVLEGTTRTISPETRTRIRGWIDQTAREVAALSGATAQVSWDGVSSALINDPRTSREVARAAGQLGEDVTVITDRPMAMIGDDFAEFMFSVPGCYAFLGTSDPKRPGTCHNIHSDKFDLDEDALVLGAVLHAQYALWWLTEGRQNEF